MTGAACPIPNAMRAGLPPLPPRMADLPIDGRGYPVPWFVAWIDGEPDHRIADARKKHQALKMGLCWLCGQPLGAFRSFVIGPMCVVNRTTAEPPAHMDCCRYSVAACPFLTRPHARRREAGKAATGAKPPPGEMLERNPGVSLIYTTKRYEAVNHAASPGAQGGVLFHLGDPESVEWFAEGRPATRAEVMASLDSGLPLLARIAIDEDDHYARRSGIVRRPRDAAQVAFRACVARAMQLIDCSLPPAARQPLQEGPSHAEG